MTRPGQLFYQKLLKVCPIRYPKTRRRYTPPFFRFLRKTSRGSGGAPTPTVRARVKDQNVSYGLRNAMRCLLDPYGPFFVGEGGGSNFEKKYFPLKIVFFLGGGILWPQWTHFDTYERQTDAKFKISAPNYPWRHANPKNGIWRHQRPLTSDNLGLTSERSTMSV